MKTFPAGSCFTLCSSKQCDIFVSSFQGAFLCCLVTLFCCATHGGESSSAAALYRGEQANWVIDTRQDWYLTWTPETSWLIASDSCDHSLFPSFEAASIYSQINSHLRNEMKFSLVAWSAEQEWGYNSYIYSSVGLIRPAVLILSQTAFYYIF